MKGGRPGAPGSWLWFMTSSDSVAALKQKKRRYYLIILEHFLVRN
jgi:hypothetical protein